jgi:GntR family transcriptional regulator, transcriptional repressor for pyruvate dehydrogenase complex
MFKVVQTSRLYEQIVRQIEELVQTGALKVGDQLPAERELAGQFSASRTAVREAVQVLREKGLVEVFPGRGTFITDGISKGIRQSMDWMVRNDQREGFAFLAEVREILEPEIVALAAMRAKEQHLAAMREAVSIMDGARWDPEAFIEAHLDFHLALAEAASNPLLLSLIDSIVGLLREQRIGIFCIEGGPERGQYHHKRILDAVEHRDSEGAREVMRAHLGQVSEDSRKSSIPRDRTD